MAFKWLGYYGKFSSLIGTFLFLLYIFDLLISTSPEIAGPLINNKEVLAYKGKEQIFREILYIFYFVSFVIHGNWLLKHVSGNNYSFSLCVLIVNSIYAFILIISTMIRSLLVYTELNFSFLAWLD